MALIKCPECGHDVSDQAASCPACGCLLTEDPKIHQTELGPVEKSAAAGTLWIVSGIIMLLGGLLMMIIFFIVGIPMLFVALAMIGTGSSRIKGTQKGTCPYCGTDIIVTVGGNTAKCKHCKKIYKQMEDHLETII